MRHNRTTISKLIASNLRIKEQIVKKVIDTFVETARERLLRGEEISFRGLGKLYVKKGKVKFKSYIRKKE